MTKGRGILGWKTFPTARHIGIGCVLSAIALSLITNAAFAEANGPSGNGVGGYGEVILVAQVALLMLVGRGLGEFMQRFGQPAIIGQLLAGLILGPSLFGWAWPAAHDLVFPKGAEQKNLITGLANMGVLMLLLLTGMETDLKLVRKVGAPAIAVTVAGVAVPFGLGFALGEVLPDSILPSSHGHLVASMFLGTALSISSIKIVAMVVREMNFMRRNLGQIIVSSAIMEDTVGWIIISVTLGIAGAGGVALGSMARTIVGTALFLVISYTAGRWLVFQLIRWVNDTFLSEYAVITAILIVMCAMALITQAIGVNTVLGAFVAGVLVGESPILSTQIQDELRGFITAFMMPIFFGLSGLSADLTILRDPNLLMLTAGLVGIATFGKFAGAFVGGKLGGLGNSESLALGCAMNARGSTEVIVASIGLSMGALTQNLYSMIVTMAVITTMAMPPMLRWALNRLPASREEQKRLTTEEIDSKGFVSRIDRLLIAGDESPNARFAVQLGGLIAGQRGKPITVLQFGAKQAADRQAGLEPVVTEAVKSGHHVPRGGEPASKADISFRIESGNPAETVTAEAANGYDLLILGFDRMYRENGAFAAAVDRIARDFRQPIALAITGRQQGVGPDVEDWKVLVPVNGTEASRRGAELAFAFSVPGRSEITVLHVARASAGGRKSTPPRNVASERSRRAVLRDAVQLGARYGHKKIASVEDMDEAADAAIVAEAERIDAQLIVIGATRRVGAALFLGETVASILQKWRGAIVVVAADDAPSEPTS